MLKENANIDMLIGYNNWDFMYTCVTKTNKYARKMRKILLKQEFIDYVSISKGEFINK